MSRMASLTFLGLAGCQPRHLSSLPHGLFNRTTWDYSRKSQAPKSGERSPTTSSHLCPASWFHGIFANTGLTFLRLLCIRITTTQAGVLFSVISAKSESCKRQGGNRCCSQFTIWIAQVGTNILKEQNSKADSKQLNKNLPILLRHPKTRWK